MTGIPLDKVRAFLKEAPPFNTLPPDVRDEVAGRLKIEYFPKGEVFIRAGEKPLEFLYLILKGSVRLFLRNGRDERLLDLRCEGDSIGSISMVEGAPPAFFAAAAEDTICYLVDRSVFIGLVESFPQFRIYSAHILDGVQPGPEPGMLLPSHWDSLAADKAMFNTPLRQLVKRPPVACRPGLSIRDAARLMTRERVGAMVIVDDEWRPLGIFTDRDIRGRVVAEGMDIDAPVEGIMHTGVATVNGDALCFEAMMTMVRLNLHHIPVLDRGALIGMVTQDDLLLLQGANPVSAVKDIDTSTGLDQLLAVQHNVDRLAGRLVRQGLSVADIQDVITLVNDRLMRRLIELGISALEARGMGTPPAEWAWVGSGSAGRKEQIMRTDHDCAIVYADPPAGREDEVQRYFLALAEEIISGLERCGFPRCKEENMANNPKWCQSVKVWSSYFQVWLREADPGVLKSAALFFDARFIYGREELVRDVMRVVRRELLGNQSFLARLAAGALADRPPLGFFRQFVVEKSGEHANRLNLKKLGLQPAVAAVRLLSLEKRQPQTNTLDRLRALEENGDLDAQTAREAAEAFNFMFMLRLKNYLHGLALDRFSFDWINPEMLGPVERRALREAFKVVARLQDAIAVRYGI